VSELATAQKGVVGHGQVLALGASRRQVDGWLAEGWLRAEHEGVYAVGHRALPRGGRFMAAVLAGGEDAGLSHRAAGSHLGLLFVEPERRRRHGAA
jgi:hypothetical protein